MTHPALVDDSLELMPDQAGLVRAFTRLLLTLTPREERALRAYYGIGSGAEETPTLRQVGEQFNVTPERVRQMIGRALRKLKHPSRCRYIRPFLYDGAYVPRRLREIEDAVKTQAIINMPWCRQPFQAPPKVKRDVLVLVKMEWPPQNVEASQKLAAYAKIIGCEVKGLDIKASPKQKQELLRVWSAIKETK